MTTATAPSTTEKFEHAAKLLHDVLSQLNSGVDIELVPPAQNMDGDDDDIPESQQAKCELVLVLHREIDCRGDVPLQIVSALTDYAGKLLKVSGVLRKALE